MIKKHLRPFLSVNPISITIGLTILVLIIFAMGISLFESIELKTYDLRLLSRGTEKPSPQIVLAAIDEKSLDVEGRWPWPRSKIAAVIDLLSEDGAKVIGFDMGFIEPDENSRLQLLNELEKKIRALKIEDANLMTFLEKSKLDADNDLALANAIKRSKAEIVLGYWFYMEKTFINFEIDDEKLKKQAQLISNSRYPITYENADLYVDPFQTAYAPEPNIEILSIAAKSSGYLNHVPDLEGDSRDGIIRSFTLIVKCGQEIYSPLSIQAVWNYLDQPQLMVRAASYGIDILMGDRLIPLDENGRILLNFLGPEKTFPYYSVSDILHNQFNEGTFKDKIVIVGATALGLGDTVNTPFSTTAEYPGPEIHATIIDNILKKDFLHKPQWTKIYDVLAILLLGLFSGFVIQRLDAIKGIIFTLSLFIIHILAGTWLFTQFDLWVNIVYPLLALILIYTCLTLYRYFTEEVERKKIRSAFSYYVSSSVANEMLKSPEKLKLGGDKKDLSVLFSDIRGFTTISEGLTPEELVHLLNEYLTVMTDIVFKYDGTLDKYMGDAIMAIYGAPVDKPDHPSRACNSALDMMENLKKLNEKWIREGKKPLDIGIGINTGMMMVGNMGSAQRFDYTVMGDAVNLGSRLEGTNKVYNTHILISESTHERVKNEFVCMELDSVRVKGKNLPVNIFELIGRPQNVTAEQREAIKFFLKGLQLYKKQKWNEAISAFEIVTAMDRNNYAAKLYIARSNNLKLTPPGPDWDGVFTMKTK
ncbi:MAG: adenylate/guanylate cyclase domain-containing protein [Deltaproteobacteria bacterium]|nr:adenylate/guanylate cyclase domain-containing protein [Deltaproteobacteria bacterium]